MATDPVVTLGLRLAGRRAVVVGGGAVAMRRVTDLLAADAKVTVIAPRLSSPLVHLAERGAVRVIRRDYADGDLDRAWLVLACADDPLINVAVATAADRAGVWCVRDDVANSSAVWVEHGVAVGGPARRILVLGGARSGKSVTAERMLAEEDIVDYVATGNPPDLADEEWARRIRLHRQRRPESWRTTETRDLAGVLATQDAVPVLIDCLSTWLAGVMDDCGLWTQRADADTAVTERVDGVIEAWRSTRRRVVAVSNEVGSGVVPATESGRRFRDELGVLNTMIAAESDEVWLCVAGVPWRLR